MRAANMSASPFLTPTTSNCIYFNASKCPLSTLLLSELILTECYSAAKNYFIKYGELGVLNCGAERVITTKHFQRAKPMSSRLNGLDVFAVAKREVKTW